MKKLLLLTLLLTIATHLLQSQVVQELNTRSAVKTWVVKDALSIPQVTTLPASPALLNYHPSASKGSPVWCTCLTDTSRIGFNVWDGTAWQTLKPIGATLPPVPAGSFLDSTGQYQGRPLISAPGQRISSSPFFLYDTALRKLVINNTNVSIGGPQYKLYVNGKTYSAGLTLGNMTNYIGAPQDDTRYPLAWDTNGDVVTFMQWPKVTSFAKNATRDSIILTFSNGSRFAVPDSVGAGGGGGVTTVGTFSSVGNAKGLSISGTDIIGHPATATEPGMVSTGAQTFSGNKISIGSLAVNGGAINASAAIAINGTDKGFLLPRLTTTDRNAISSPAHYLLIANTSDNDLQWYDGTFSVWRSLSSQLQRNGTNVFQFGFANNGTVGLRNTEIGVGTGSNRTAGGNDNTSLGHNAVGSVFGGNYTGTTGIGSSALAVSSGSYNTAVGNAAGGAISGSTHSNNTHVGAYAQSQGSSGIGNSVFGAFALRYGGGSYNTYVGTNTAAFNTGSFNTQIGYNAAQAGGSGTYNIVLGAYVEVPTIGNSGQLNIGNVLYGIGMHSTTTNSATPTTNGRIGIGVAVPHASAALDVAGTDKGFLPPRMTQTQRNAISSPANGLIIYCTDCLDNGGVNAGVLQVYQSSSSSWKNAF